MYTQSFVQQTTESLYFSYPRTLMMTVGGFPVTCSGEAPGRKGVLVNVETHTGIGILYQRSYD